MNDNEAKQITLEIHNRVQVLNDYCRDVGVEFFFHFYIPDTADNAVYSLNQSGKFPLEQPYVALSHSFTPTMFDLQEFLNKLAQLHIATDLMGQPKKNRPVA